MTRTRAPLAISTLYESLTASAIDCAAFVAAVEDGLRGRGFMLVETDATEDHFFVHLGFDEIDDNVRAVSVVVGFHATDSTPPADYFLRQYVGHFMAGQEKHSAELLVEALDEELERRIEEGWLKP